MWGQAARSSHIALCVEVHIFSQSLVVKQPHVGSGIQEQPYSIMCGVHIFSQFSQLSKVRLGACVNDCPYVCNCVHAVELAFKIDFCK